MTHATRRKDCRLSRPSVWQVDSAAHSAIQPVYSPSLDVPMHMRDRTKCARSASQKWPLCRMRLRDRPPHEARTEEGAILQRLERHGAAVPQSASSKVERLWWPRYRPLRGMDGSSYILARHGADLQTRTHNRARGRERQLRAEQLHLDSSRGAIKESPSCLRVEGEAERQAKAFA